MLTTAGMQLVAGRNFDPKLTLDTANYIINEAAAKVMGMTEPLGQTIEFWEQKGHIIGVVKDFHYQSLHQTIGPVILRYDPIKANFLLIKTKTNQTAQAVASVRQLHKQYSPQTVLGYQFLDDEYRKKYASEKMVNQLTMYFTGLAITISALGLLGLVAYQVEQRRKEISIRKVLGANLAHVMGLISKSFLTMVGLALLLAIPLAWYIMHDWLQSFAYRIELGWLPFAIAAAAAITLSAITVFSQVVKTIKTNLSESL